MSIELNQVKIFIKKLFYKRKGNVKKIKFLGITIVKIKKSANKKTVKILGVSLLKIQKTPKKKTVKFLGITLFKRKKYPSKNKYYLFGIKLFTKKKSNDSFIVNSEEYYIKLVKQQTKNFHKKKKIVLFSHDFTTSGAPLALFKIVKILKRNYDVLIIAPVDGTAKSILSKNKIPYLVIPELNNLNISILNKLFSSFDFAICNTWITSHLALKLQNILPTLSYIHEASEGLVCLLSGKDNKINQVRVKDIISNLKNTAYVSEFAKNFFNPYIQNNSYYIHNYVDDLSNYKNKKTNPQIIKFSCICCVENVRKNIDIVYNCFKKLQKKYPNIELHLIGNDKTTLANKIKAENNPAIIFHGEQPENIKNKLMSEMDIIVVASKIESCSLVSLEAASLGKSIIITENVGAKYMFEHEKSCLICKPDDEADLYEKMERYIKDPILRKKTATEARKSFELHAQKENTKKELEKVITKTIESFHKETKNEVSIIIPVYNALDKLKKCVSSILENTKLSEEINLLIIDDKSPDTNVKQYLSTMSQNPYIKIVYNDVNLGYTKNINKAIKLCGNRDVILLNSDTIVTRNWLKKIREKAYLSPSIGTVTPVSNSAGAFSVPKIGKNIIPDDMEIQDIANLVEKIGKDKYFDAPTGNGFCFYIKRSVIEKIGLFDEINFPTGYGEENDYSMRAKQNGFLNIITLDTYIFHHEHSSFGKQSEILCQKNQLTLNSLYPSYGAECKVFWNNITFNEFKNKLNVLINENENKLQIDEQNIKKN